MMFKLLVKFLEIILFSSFRVIEKLGFRPRFVKDGIASLDMERANFAILEQDFETAYNTLKKYETEKLESRNVGGCLWFLACLYFKGLYVNRNIDLAIDLMQRAVMCNNENAIDYLRRRNKKLAAGLDVDNFKPWF